MVQQAFSMASDRLGRIVEGAASEVYLFSTDDYRFSLVNRGARQNLGFSMDELRTMTPWDIKPQISKADFLKLVEPLLEGEGNELKFETSHQRKDGSCYEVWVHLQLIITDGEKIFYAAIQDTTKQKQIAAALAEASTRLDAILGNTTMAIFMMDERQQCVFMNKAAEELTGYKFEETRGRPLHDVVHHTHPDGRPFPIEECAIDRAFPENNQTQGEETFVHKDGSFYPVGFTASPMKDESGQTVGTIIEVRDISDELRARNAEMMFNKALQAKIDEAMVERDRLEARLVQAQKMEAVGQLTGGIAHDFNNLLQVVGSNLQILLKEFSASDTKRKFAENAMAGVARGATLTAQLLAFGRQQPLDPKPKNLGGLLEGMNEMLQRTLGEAIEIDMQIPDGLWNCFADPAQVENVILNLSINARDAMNHRGKLTLVVRNTVIEETVANVDQNFEAGQYVMLAVKDSGSGISSEILDKVFDPFFTTKASGEGTGLGLSMVYGFVKQSGGHIEICSEEGKGTTVRVYLPRTELEEEIEQPPQILDAPLGQGEVILVVEDDAAVQETVVDLLRDLGYAVLTADNADNALAIVKSGTMIDVLFTDVVMPGTLRSPDLARLAKEWLPEIEVLFTSGHPQGAIVNDGRLNENIELLSKPYSRDHLAQKMHDVIGRNSSRVEVDSPVQASSSSAVDDGVLSKGSRVLLVEDDVLIRMNTADMLSDLGYFVSEAGTIREAVKLLSENDFQFILTDLGLPDGPGMDLVRRVSEEHPGTAVIVASGSHPSDYDESNDLGRPVISLMKPYDQESLKRALQQSIEVVSRPSELLCSTRLH